MGYKFFKEHAKNFEKIEEFWGAFLAVSNEKARQNRQVYRIKNAAYKVTFDTRKMLHTSKGFKSVFSDNSGGIE
jgi:hypothetical protein